MTHVCNCKVAFIRPQYRDLQEWCEDPNNVYVARRGVVFITDAEGTKTRYPPRDSIWANPFKVTDEGQRDTVITQYEAYIRKKIKDENLVSELLKLRGKNLGCWCKPLPCHGDVLLKFIQELSM